MTDDEEKVFPPTVGRAAFRVCWRPNETAGKEFAMPVFDFDEGLELMVYLSNYDAYLHDVRILPQFESMGFLEWTHPELTGGKWVEIENPHTDEGQEEVMAAYEKITDVDNLHDNPYEEVPTEEQYAPPIQGKVTRH